MSGARLNGKVALISGGASGIGLAAAREFIAQGAAVVIGDISAHALEDATQAHSSLIGKSLDVTDESSWKTLVDDVLAQFGRLDILVNSAGIALGGDIETISLEAWRRTMAINVDGVFFGCRHGVRAMKSHGGSIVNMSSVSGLIGGHNMAAYNASKGAVRLLTKSVALHCARKRYGIRCNSVHPTFVNTPMVEKMFEGRDATERARVAKAMTAQVPLGRFAEPQEIADLLVYLASDESQFVTGSEMVIDGGLTAQ